MPAWTDNVSHVFYRIQNKKYAISFPPPEKCGEGRFDDPLEPPEYRVLYTADRRAAFLEVLVKFRPAPRWAAISVPGFPDDWLEHFRIFELRVIPGNGTNGWLDFTSFETFTDLDHALPYVLRAHSRLHFDLSFATSAERAVTKPVGRWAFENNASGVFYACRFDGSLRCWAVFEHQSEVEAASDAIEISPSDHDFIAVLTAYGIAFPSISSARPTSDPSE
jgi:hypothetical protein